MDIRADGNGHNGTNSGSGGALLADFVSKAQFDDIWSRTQSRSSEQRLLLAVLERAVLDLFKYRYARRRRYQRLYRETYEWVAAEEHAWPYSFVNVCAALGLEADAVRRRLLDGDWAPIESAAIEQAA